MSFFTRLRAASPHRCGLALMLFLASLLWLSPAWAQDDPPGRVGRVADVKGTVWVYDFDAGEWINAVRNRPITSGDRLSTEADARAEIRIGSSTLRLSEGTALEVVQLDDDIVRLRLQSGAIALRLRTPEAAREFVVVTDEGRFDATRPGHYRYDRFNDISAATVWQGGLRFESVDSALELEVGRRTEFWRDGGTRYTMREVDRDAFADWAIAENRRDDANVSQRYVSPEMTGVEDLERYGRWEGQSEYGPLWVPYRVNAGWAPYRYGHWAWVRPWGWTWVDDAPWGFAPFHYGRWVWFRGSWCWAPGQYVARPVFAPALVAWVGGPAANVSITIGSRRPAPVGWFPLAPREVYVPTYRTSPVYQRNVNGGHAVNLPPYGDANGAPPHARYVNRNNGGVTVVPNDVFIRRQPVGPQAARYSDPRLVGEMMNEPVRLAPPVAPPRAVAVPSMGGVPAAPGRTVTPGVQWHRPQNDAQVPVPPQREPAMPGRPQAPEVRAQPPVMPQRGLGGAQPVPYGGVQAQESVMVPRQREHSGQREVPPRGQGMPQTAPALPEVRMSPPPQAMPQPARPMPPPEPRPQQPPPQPQQQVVPQAPVMPQMAPPPRSAVPDPRMMPPGERGQRQQGGAQQGGGQQGGQWHRRGGDDRER